SNRNRTRRTPHPAIPASVVASNQPCVRVPYEAHSHRQLDLIDDLACDAVVLDVGVWVVVPVRHPDRTSVATWQESERRADPERITSERDRDTPNLLGRECDPSLPAHRVIQRRGCLVERHGGRLDLQLGKTNQAEVGTRGLIT